MKNLNICSIVLLAIALIGFGAIGGMAADPSCPASTTLCNGECHPLDIDELNCGSCGNICPLGMACVNGTCACLPGQTLCGGKCIDTSINPHNCGSCGKACPEDMYCFNGECSCSIGTLCNGTCIDTSNDDANCGSCGNLCPSGTSCFNGTCLGVDVYYSTPNPNKEGYL